MSDTSFISNWPLKLWDFTKHYQFIGWSGGYGIGYGAPRPSAPRWRTGSTAG